MAQTACPQLKNFLASDNCLENLAGLGSSLYYFAKKDLQAKLTLTGNTFSTPSFASGAGLYKIDAKEQTVQLTGGSLKKRGGFKQELKFTIQANNAQTAELNRALNNHEIGFIVVDNDVSYIVYDPIYNGAFDADGISADTGAAATDDRQVTYTYLLQPCLYDKHL